ncbi:LysR family transcriptional regulator [Burkholderia multivorans]|nr:LysR family transcriptional regulator [Burkholderia multivorans]
MTAAAIECRIAQSALSRHVQALEDELGFKLFHNMRNRLQLTPAGHGFEPMARALLATARRVETATRALVEGRMERLHLAATPITVRSLIAPFLSTLPPTAPMILTHEIEHAHVYDALHAGKDLVIAPTPSPKELACRVLVKTPLKAYVSKNHRRVENGVERVSVAARLRQPLVLHTVRSTSRQVLDQAIARQELHYGLFEECDDSHTMLALAASGQCVSVTTDRPLFDAVGVDVVETEEQTKDASKETRLAVTLYAAWDASHYRAATVEWLVDQLLAHIAHLKAVSGPIWKADNPPSVFRS